MIKTDTNIRIRQLKEAVDNHESLEIAELLTQLTSAPEALSLENIMMLFDIIFLSRLSSIHKTTIVKHLLIPKDVLPLRLLYRILGCIGKPMPSSSLEKSSSSLKVPWNLQGHLLNWLVCWIHAFETDTPLKLVTPLLYNLLPYEFSRQSIVHLIILSRSDIRKWQVQLVVDLFLRFPTDDYLKLLLVMFKLKDPWIDLNDFSNVKLALGSINATLEYPEPALLKDISLNKSKLDDNLRFYSRFNSQIPSRLKKTPILYEILTPPIYNYKDVIDQLEEHHFLDFPTFITNQFTINYGLFASGYIVVIDKSIKLHILDLTPASIADFINKLIRIQQYGVFLESVQDFILFKTKPLAMSEITVLPYRLKLLKYLDKSKIGEFLEKSTNLLLTYPHFISEFLYQFVISLQYWKYEDLPPIYNWITFLFTQTHRDSLDRLKDNISLIILLKQLRKLHNKGPNCIPPPPIAYSLLLSPNPVVISEICGYIAYAKHENLGKLQMLNAYTMDFINFLWRSKGINYDSPSSGMFLSSKFVDNLRKLPLFDYSEISTFENMGDIFHNPAWAPVTTKSLRQLEDTKEVSLRHIGPVTAESVDSMSQGWLEITYDQLKVEVLRSLDKYQFTGVADLLFMSMKNLQGERQK